MMNIEQITTNLKSYIVSQIDTLSKSTPIISFMRPLIIRALDKNFNKVSGLLELISDSNGNIDIENILPEMIENVLTTNPFTLRTSFIGNIEIGNGQIKVNLPLTDKNLVLNQSDLETLKEMLITK